MKLKHVLFIIIILFLNDELTAQSNYLETVKVTDSIYVFKPKIDWYQGNGTAIISSSGVFFVDTYLSPNYAFEAIERLKKITKLPVSYVLNTHWHYDHMYGNYEFKKAFPDCKFIMHDSTYYFLKTQVQPLVDKDLELTKQGLAQFENERKVRKSSNGLTITDSMVPYWDMLIEETKEVLRDYRPVKLINGDITFDDKLTIRWGSQTLKLMHLKQYAHSEGDIIVWIPEKKLVITGDIVVGPTPYETQPNAEGIVKALQYVIDMNPSIVIPGHGAVQHDLSYVKLEKEAFEAYLREAEKAVKNNIPLKDAGAYIKLDELDYKFTKGDDLAKWAYRSYFRGHIINQVYKKYNAIPKK